MMPRAACLLAVVLLGAGCGGGGSDGRSAGDILLESADKTSAVKTFHVVVNIENVAVPRSGLGLTFVDGDIVVPDKLQAKIGGTFMGLPVNTELVVLGGKPLLKNPFTGKWVAIDIATTPVVFFDPTAGVIAVIRGATAVTDDGSEEVDGIDSHHLKAKVRSEALKPLLATKGGDELVPIELWIGKDDLLLRRLRVSGPAADGDGEDAVRTVELSAFDEPVTIKAPPVSP
jgi:hypothetical protein